MQDFDEQRPISELRAEWDAMTQEERDIEMDEYHFQVISGGHDAGNHPYHAILKQEC